MNLENLVSVVGGVSNVLANICLCKYMYSNSFSFWFVSSASNELIVEGRGSSGRRQQWEESAMGGACGGRSHSWEGQVVGGAGLVLLNVFTMCVCLL